MPNQKAAEATQKCLQFNFIEAGVADPTVSPGQDAPRGALYIQQSDYPTITPIALWQKNDWGVTTNWTNITGGGGGTVPAIAGLYFVASNGNDGTGTGSIAAPFLTIQAAINKAVTDGHGFASQAQVLVMPAATTYAGFTSANGVSVAGLPSGQSVVKVGQSVIMPDASGQATNFVGLEQLNFRFAGDNCLIFGAGNAGNARVEDCDFTVTGTPAAAVFMGNVGSLTVVDSNVSSTGVGYEQGNGTLNIQGDCITTTVAQALDLVSGVFQGQGGVYTSTGGGVATIEAASNFFLADARVRNSSAAASSAGLSFLSGALASTTKVSISVASTNFNYVVASGADYTQAFTDFLDSSNKTVSVSGGAFTGGIDLLDYVPAVPGNWSPVPTAIQPALDQLGARSSSSVSLAPVGAAPNADAATLTGSVLNLQPFGSAFPGVVPASGGGTTDFLRADGTWAAPPGGGGTQASNYYVVANNGNDANSGSWTSPFFTIQAAITAAVAAGASYSNPWDILVLPSGVPYAGFTTANGVSVKGFHGDRFGATVGGLVSLIPDASGVATNYVEISNLRILVSSGNAVHASGSNVGNFYFRNVDIVLETPGTSDPAVFINQSTSNIIFDDCSITNSTVGEAAILISSPANVTAYNGTVVTALAWAALVNAGTFTANECILTSSEGGVAVVSASAATVVLTECFLTNSSAAGSSPGVELRSAAIGVLYYTNLSVAGTNFNYDAVSGCLVEQSFLTFSGASKAVSNGGTQVNQNIDLLEYAPTIPANWPSPPTTIQEALDELAANSSSEFTEFDTVTSGQATAKQITLIHTPNLPTQVVVAFGGVTQFYGTDYSVAANVLSWSGLGMDSIGVVAGDQLVISYVI